MVSEDYRKVIEEKLGIEVSQPNRGECASEQSQQVTHQQDQGRKNPSSALEAGSRFDYENVGGAIDSDFHAPKGGEC